MRKPLKHLLYKPLIVREKLQHSKNDTQLFNSLLTVVTSIIWLKDARNGFHVSRWGQTEEALVSLTSVSFSPGPSC